MLLSKIPTFRPLLRCRKKNVFYAKLRIVCPGLNPVRGLLKLQLMHSDICYVQLRDNLTNNVRPEPSVCL